MRSTAVAGDETATRDKLIAATAQCIISDGPNISSRMIARTSDINSALINYYFGTKENLIREAFRSLATPINQNRHARLDACREKAASNDIGMREIVEAFIVPYFESPGGIETGRAVAWISLASRHTPTDFARSLITEHFDPIAQKTIELLQMTDKALSVRSVHQKYFFMSGAVLASLTGSQPNGRLDQLLHLSEEDRPLTSEELCGSLVEFVLNGLTVDSR